ncbi:BRCT domain-containing protein [Salinimicrobium sp. 3283s]|uniref:BRCT domain-containing protein n=1 Tax=Salinimicrobium sp. 3283s TaxID=3114359 RepID=UPI0031F12905
METILILVIVGLVIYIIWPKKKRETSSQKSGSPLTAGEDSKTKNLTKTVYPSKNNFNLDLSTEEEDSGREYLEEYYDITGVHIPSRKDYILNHCEELDPVFLRKEPSNPVNPEAVAIYHYEQLIGYIPDIDLDDVHKYYDRISDASISEIEYDGDFLRVEINVEHEITRKKSKPKPSASTSNLNPEDFMRFKQNEIPSEYLKPKKEGGDPSSYFYGKKVCISGSLDNFPYRAELAKHLWDVGADVDTGVGKTCSILISGEGVGPSKLKQAKAGGVQIMYEPELMEKLNGFKSSFV